jgi:O-Antigen ligase
MHSRVPIVAQVQSIPYGVRTMTALAALLTLAGIIIPTEVQFFIAGLRFSPGRISVIVLFLPALLVLFGKSRRLLLCDLFAFAIAGWMLVAGISTGGMIALSHATAGEALDFFGGYLIARAFFFGPLALTTFIRVLEAFAIVAILLGVADHMSGRLIVHDTIGSIVHASNLPVAGYRLNTVRAASTFDHEILFGVFCAVVAAILLYWEQSLLRWSLAISLCSLGCILSLSSAAVMALSMILIGYTYDRLMRRYSWRWTLAWAIAGVLILALILMANHPLNWIILHATFDPQSGYYRYLIWGTAIDYIARAPLTGYGYVRFNNQFLESVDSIWLIYSLRFGIPMAMLLLLTNIAAILPTKWKSGYRKDDPYMDGMRRAFTFALLVFMFTGLTVHFWNFMWMFWGVCIGIRASLRELSIEIRGRSYRYPQRAPAPTVS